jgi:hypothetical protein
VWSKHESGGGTLWYRREGAVIESVALGPMDDSNPKVLTKLLETAHAEAGWCAAFHDWDRASSYSTAMRLGWVQWAVTPAARAARFTHFRLSKDRLLRMAVSVASVAFAPQKFTVHETAGTYAAARREFLKEPLPIPEVGPRRL